MKQKRKVKNLLQEKEVTTSNILTAFLFMLSGILCLGAIAIFSLSKVSLAEQVYVNPQDLQQLEYVGVTDKTETLYEVKFVNPNKISEDIHSIKVKGTSVYISPKSVIVNPRSTETSNDMIYPSNKVSTDVYSNILGGMGNTVNSKNVTIIAGEGNTVNPSNENATLLGGKGNTLDGNVGKSAVMLGGEGNKIVNKNEGDVIIGGKKNEIGGGASYANILGGRDNTINGRRAIVGGINITVAGNEEDVFVFNNDNTKNINISSTDPKDTSDTFYLSVSEGLGINTSTTTKGVEVKGGVGFGAININKICDDSTLGVQGIWNGCLVGCTKKSKGHGWELLDYGENCRAECAKPGNEKCIDTSVPYEERAGNKEGVCTEGVVNTYQSVQCGGEGIEKSFYNVVFETTLIDSAKTVDGNNSGIKCPADGGNQDLINNKCVFQCVEGTHLRVNENEFTATDGKVIKEGEIGCFRDCKLDGKPIEHNKTIYGYNVREVTCSNHSYIFPEQFSLGNNLFTRLINGISPETCGNTVAGHHKELLICIDGTLYLESGDRNVKANENYVGDKEDAYNKKDCTLKEYKCKTDDDNYNLTMQRLSLGKVKVTPTTSLSQYNSYVTPYEDQINEYRTRGSILGADDRSQPFGWTTRGTYELCIDFKPVNGTNDQCNRVGLSNNNEKLYHYKLVKCNDDGSTKYRTGAVHPYECRPVYTLTYDAGTNAQFPSNNQHSENVTAEFTWQSVVPVALTDSNAPKATKKDGRDGVNYEFLGWNTDPDAHEGLTSYTMPNHNQTLYAIYRRTYTANFDKNGATEIGSTKLTCQAWNNDQTCNSTNPIKGPTIRRDSADLTNPFTIVGWSTDPNSHTGTPVGQNLIVPADSKKTSVTYYAITHKVVTITFYLNGNKSQTPKGGSATIVPSVTQTNDIWNRDTKCSITSPAIDCSEVKDVQNQNNTVKKSLIGYSTAAARHENDYVPNTARDFVDNASFYAQCKKDITVTFKLNGNISQTDSAGVSQLGDVTRVGTYYNGDTYFTIKSPGLDANESTNVLDSTKKVKKDVIGYSTAANRHVNDWSVNTDKNISDNMTYYAQSKKDVTVTFNVNGNGGSNSTKSCTYFNDQEYCGHSKCDVPECKAPVCPAITPNSNPVPKMVWRWSTMAAEFHGVCDVNASRTVSDNVTFYAWSKKPVTVTFDVNGNGGSNSTAQCEYYNDMKSCGDSKCNSAGCKAPKSPSITANNTPKQKTVIGWSTAADRHENDWTPNTQQAKYDDITYYAQSVKEVKMTFDKNGATSQTLKGGTASTAQTVSQKCYYYNAETSCNGTRSENTNTIRSPTITRSNFTIVGYNTNKDAKTSTWNHNTKKTDLIDDVTYYAISKRIPVLTVKKDDTSVSAIGTNQSCEIWNRATSCDVTMPTITCGAGWSNGLWNTSSTYPNPKSNGKTVGSTLTLTSDVTYYGVCEDVTAPACTITTEPTKTPISKVSGYTQGTFTVTCLDLGSKVKTSSLAASAIDYTSTVVSLSAATVANVTNGKSYTFTYTASAQGTTTFKLKAGQVADNWNNTNVATNATNTVTIDTTKPTLDANNHSAWKTSDITITLSVGDTGGAGLNYAKYSWTSAADCTSNGTSFSNGTKITNSTEGIRTLYLCAGDKAGNTNTWNAKYYLDKTAPSCTNGGDSTTWTNSNRTITYGCSDGNSGCKSGASGGSTTYSSTTKTATIAAYTITDNAGNSTSCAARTANVYVDKTAPSCTNGGDSTTWVSANRTITYGCSDGNSGCNSSYAGGSKTFTTRTTTATIAAYTIKDNAGNSTSCPARTANVYVWPSSCTICGATVAHGGSRTCYASDKPAGACSSETRTCNDGTASGSYGYSSCNAGCKYPWNNNYMTHGTSITAWSSSSATSPTMCASQTRTCSNGSLGGSYTNSSCTQYYRSCTICGATVAHNDSRTCWNYSSPTSPTMCISESRKCNDGTPTGSYTNSSCTQQYRSCSGCPSGTVAHNGTCESYARCSGTKITSKCSDGSWDKTPGGYSSAGQGCYSCSGCPSGTVAHNGTCASYARCSWTKITSKCSDGSWDKTPGGYSSAGQGCYSCQALGCCPVTSHDGTCTCYTQSSATSPKTCQDYVGYFKCTDGAWSYTPFSYGSCTQYYRSCWSSACGTVSHGDTCKTYVSNVHQKCELVGNAVLSTCNDGTWVNDPSSASGPGNYTTCRFPNGCAGTGGCAYTQPGTYCNTYKTSISNSCGSFAVSSYCWDGSYSPEPGGYSSCSAPASCWSSACGTVAHGNSCTTYSSQGEYYNRCDRVSRTSKCNNGNWDLSPYSYSSCTDLGTPKQSCSAVGPCPATEHGGTCHAYAYDVTIKCGTWEKYYTCDDGTWYMGNYVATPTGYSSCRLPYDCPAQNGCPSEKGWNDTVPCVTYSESSAYYNRCDRVKITSYCHDGNWTPTPGSYTYCTNISGGPDTGGGSTGGTVSYKWTKISGTCSTGSVTTTSCTPGANCSTSGKTCCLGGTYYTCK